MRENGLDSVVMGTYDSFGWKLRERAIPLSLIVDPPFRTPKRPSWVGLRVAKTAEFAEQARQQQPTQPIKIDELRHNTQMYIFDTVGSNIPYPNALQRIIPTEARSTGKPIAFAEVNRSARQ